METDHIGHEYLTIQQLTDLWRRPEKKVALHPAAAERIRANRQYLDRKLANTEDLLYGINTGFGSLCNIRISDDEIGDLQTNIVQSHACGMGDEVPGEIVRLMLLLKVQSFSYGYSGVRVELVQRLLDLYNEGILPVIYQLGSLGASGDLAPLAHLSLPVLGMGEVRYHGEKMPAAQALQAAGLSPMRLQAKEGLALLNGTQFSMAYAVWSVWHAGRLGQVADLCAAFSADVFLCRDSPYDEAIQRIRPHQGQVISAARIRSLLQGSELQQQEKPWVQDPYSFRCVPQVHGASLQAVDFVGQTVHTELNSVTDNPNVFADEDRILSGGNFHAQPVALALDFLAIALAELGNISERRTFQLISGLRDLPPFLTSKPGLHSGLMIPQYTAASIVSQSKQYCTPASVDSIVSSAGQEDHVSMAANAGTKCYHVVSNTWRLLGIEWMTAAQAYDFRRPGLTGAVLHRFWTEYRKIVPRLDGDRILQPDMEASVRFLQTIADDLSF